MWLRFSFIYGANPLKFLQKTIFYGGIYGKSTGSDGF